MTETRNELRCARRGCGRLEDEHYDPTIDCPRWEAPAPPVLVAANRHLAELNALFDERRRRRQRGAD